MNIELSFHVKDNTLVRSSCSTTLDSLKASIIGDLRQTVLVPVKLRIRRRTSILAAFNTSPGFIAVISACCDSSVLDDSVVLFLFMTKTVVAESRGNHFIREESELGIDTARRDEHRIFHNAVSHK